MLKPKPGVIAQPPSAVTLAPLSTVAAAAPGVADFKKGTGARLIETVGELRQHDPYSYTIRDREQKSARSRVLANWWPHKRKFKLENPNEAARHGDAAALVAAIKAAQS